MKGFAIFAALLTGIPGGILLLWGIVRSVIVAYQQAGLMGGIACIGLFPFGTIFEFFYTGFAQGSWLVAELIGGGTVLLAIGCFFVSKADDA